MTLPAAKTSEFEIDAVRLVCDTFGAGPPILFVHGFPLDGRMWHPAVERLAARFRCIVPDLRGFGRSGTSPQASMTRFADDLAALLDHLRENQPVVLCGLSMGGIIGFEFFRRHRARLAGLILCNTRAKPESPEGVVRREKTATDVLRDGSRTIADAMIGSILAPTAPEALRQWSHAMMASQPPIGVAASARALGTRPDSYPTLARIDLPTLVIAGSHDTITPPPTLSEIAAGIPGARLVTIENSGHLSPAEQPDAFAAAVMNYAGS